MAAIEAVTEGGNINLAGSGIVGDVVTIQPQLYNGMWRNFYFKLTNANDWHPTFSCIWAGHDTWGYTAASADSMNLYAVYTYTPDDPSSWVIASSNSLSADSLKVEWSFDESFTEDNVYVSLLEIVTPSMILSWMNTLPGIRETPSAIAFGGETYQYGVIPTVTDVNGRVIPALKQYCFEIGTGEKEVVIFGGVHAGEHLGSIQLLGFIDSVASDTPIGKMLRDTFTFHVYPMINAQGRYGGETR